MAKEDFKVTNNRKKNAKNQQIVLEGDLGIFNSPKIVKKLKRLKIDAEEVTLSTKNVDGFDLSSVQTLIAIQKQVVENKGKLNFDIDLPDDKVKLLETTGFQFLLNK